MIRVMFVMIVSMVVISPCLLIFNESGNFLPNFVGFLWIVVLCIIGRTKVGKLAIREVEKANKLIEDIFF